jgi:ABC-2 type transport system ATP-binding protein
MSVESSPARIVIRGLSKAYANVQAVSDVNFEIRAGEVFGLLGPNGAGKTTTVESVIGLTDPDSGSVTICDIDARRHPQQAKQRIGAALQGTALQDKITPREALHLFGTLYRNSISAGTLLERFGLATKADASFDSLSGGQRQRLALALAFVNDPQAIFLDEPSAGLDPQMRRELHDHIRQMKLEGRAVLMTTHDMDEAEQLCDRVAILDGGRIVAEGSPNSLIAGSRSASCITIQTTPGLRREWLDGLSNVREILCDADSARLTTSTLHQTLAELTVLLDARQVEITSLRAGKATLEDVILEIIGSHRRGDMQ